MGKTNKKGFTLAELLIVIAIMAVLIAIAIPVFSMQLQKARKAVDEGNLRSAESMSVSAYLSEAKTGEVVYEVYIDGDNMYVYGPDATSKTGSALTGESDSLTETPLTVTVKDGAVTAKSWTIPE